MAVFGRIISKISQQVKKIFVTKADIWQPIIPRIEKESVFYLQNLIGNPEHPLWAIKSRFRNITNSLKYLILLILLVFDFWIIL